MAITSPTRSCPVARTANIVGMPWTALILRDLVLKGVCRYQELLDSLKGIAPNTLSERLKLLESNGIVERRLYEQHPPRAEYVLTPKGRELGPIIRAMREWGEKHTGVKAPGDLRLAERRSQPKSAKSA
jgi:DNA-binding HxlR family transcriptional regulator